MRNEIWEKNLNAMNKWYPKFVEALQKEHEIEDDTEVFVEQSWDGETIFRVKKGEQLLYLGGKRDARKPIQAWLEHMGTIHNYGAIFLFGIGSGAYLKAVMKDFPKEANIIVYEPSIHIFQTVLHEVDLSEEISSHPIGFVVEGMNEAEFEPIVERTVILENMDYFKEEIHPNYGKLFGEQLKSYIVNLHKHVEHIVVRENTMHRFSTVLAQNTIRNLKLITQGYNSRLLADAIPHDGTAILVSAGPSLNKNIRELKRAKNKCFIMAVDTAVKPLMKAGVVPDMMATIDALKPAGLVDIEGADEIPILTPPCAVPAMLENRKGKCLFYSNGYSYPISMYAQLRKEMPGVAVGGSVACSAFSLLYMIGFDNIILVGQDLALTGNRTHADGTFQDKMPEIDISKSPMVKGNCKDMVPTRGDFKLYLAWFNEYIEGIKKRRNVTVYNATEGGAYIEGTEVVTLKDILDQVCGEEDIDFAGMIRDMDSEFTEEEQKKAWEYAKKLPDEMAAIQKNGKELKKIYVRLRKLANSGNMNQTSVQKQLKRVKKLTNDCMARPAYQFIEMSTALADTLVRSEQYAGSDSMEEEIREIARKGILYSDILIKCAALFKEYSEEVLLS